MVKSSTLLENSAGGASVVENGFTLVGLKLVLIDH